MKLRHFLKTLGLGLAACPAALKACAPKGHWGPFVPGPSQPQSGCIIARRPDCGCIRGVHLLHHSDCPEVEAQLRKWVNEFLDEADRLGLAVYWAGGYQWPKALLPCPLGHMDHQQVILTENVNEIYVPPPRYEAGTPIV